jgi:hypothetical protein
MPAKWSKYDDQRLPNPKDSTGGDDAQPDDRGTPPHLQMNWTSPHTPKPPPKNDSSTSGDGSGNGNGDGKDQDPDSGYYNPSVAGAPRGVPYRPMPWDYDRLEVNTDDLGAYEQNILSAAGNVVSQYNALAERSKTVLTEDIWGRGEGKWTQPHPNHQNVDNVDPQPLFVSTDSAVTADAFTKSIRSAQDGALHGAADLITLSGMFITVLDATVSSYAQMDMMAVFPDVHQLKAPNP